MPVAIVETRAPKSRLRCWMLAVLGAAILCLAWLSLSYLQPTTLPCAQARVLVTSRHGAVFNFMRDAVGPVSLGCAHDPARDVDLVTIAWNQGAVEHRATYAAGLDGAVRPVDANAASLERLAQQLERHGGAVSPDSFGAPTFR
ncbi:MAG: hypothetical protein ACRDIY_05255 [Chloroflexota bacterium]